MKLTPQQKEQLNRPRPLLFLGILGLFSLPWLLLFRNGVLSRQQQQATAIQSNAFFAQVETYPRNVSAQQFDILGADLGFDPNDPRNLDFKLDRPAAIAYRQIEDDLTLFIQTQAARGSGPLSPLPPQLLAYLQFAKPELERIQTHLLEREPPAWEMDVAQMSEQNYPFPSLANTANVQKLLLLTAIDSHRRSQYVEMQTALEASWRLNQAIVRRPDLVSQVSASVISSYQTGLLRHFSNVPAQWQARLAQPPSVLSGLTFDVWLQYVTLQKLLAATAQGINADASTASIQAPDQALANVSELGPAARLAGALSYWFSPVHYFMLTNIDTAKTAHRAIDQLQSLNVCSTAQSEAQTLLSEQETARWNEAIAPVPSVLARRWKTAGDRALAQELTQQILLAKQHVETTGHWPKSLPNKASKACPGEYWIYEHASDNTVAFSLSRPLASRLRTSALPTTTLPIPLRYSTSKKAPSGIVHSELKDKE